MNKFNREISFFVVAIVALSLLPGCEKIREKYFKSEIKQDEPVPSTQEYRRRPAANPQANNSVIPQWKSAPTRYGRGGGFNGGYSGGYPQQAPQAPYPTMGGEAMGGAYPQAGQSPYPPAIPSYPSAGGGSIPSFGNNPPQQGVGYPPVSGGYPDSQDPFAAYPRGKYITKFEPMAMEVSLDEEISEKYDPVDMEKMLKKKRKGSSMFPLKDYSPQAHTSSGSTMFPLDDYRPKSNAVSEQNDKADLSDIPARPDNLTSIEEKKAAMERLLQLRKEAMGEIVDAQKSIEKQNVVYQRPVENENQGDSFVRGKDESLDSFIQRALSENMFLKDDAQQIVFDNKESQEGAIKEEVKKEDTAKKTDIVVAKEPVVIKKNNEDVPSIESLPSKLPVSNEQRNDVIIKADKNPEIPTVSVIQPVATNKVEEVITAKEDDIPAVKVVVEKNKDDLVAKTEPASYNTETISTIVPPPVVSLESNEAVQEAVPYIPVSRVKTYSRKRSHGLLKKSRYAERRH
ncbi:hypothetical protein N9W34_05165 [Rickettsiales bacterium]|nr:hypothetical protein [Rickettsiales bacterium]